METMKKKEDFPKVVIYGMSVVITILIGFPLLAYFCFKDKTRDVKILLFRLSYRI